MMGEEIHIRPALTADELAIRACAEDAYAQYVAAIGKKPAPMVADFAALIGAGHVHVATSAKLGVVGFIVFFQQDDCVFLENVAVHSGAIGQGVGKRLIAFCEDEATRLGAKSVRLYTNEKMTENLSIYPHLGYRETERKSEDGFNRVFFEKHL